MEIIKKKAVAGKIEGESGSTSEWKTRRKLTTKARLESAAMQVPIMEGELEVQASVTIVFEIK